MPRRSLILAGGGLKVAYQAGVLQVWLDEAGIAFDHADGASGGVFNLAMYCQGLTGREIANNWRNFPVLSSISINWRQLLRLFWAESLLTYDGFKAAVLQRQWKLDWRKIASGARCATFNAYNFTEHRLVVRTEREVDEDFLIAGVSLPGWFPPVRIGQSQYVDAVYVTDANLMTAIERGADEIWIIWTVNRAGVWRGGPINTYFQIIEASANGNLRRDLARIHANNEAFDRGDSSEFGRRIKVEMIVGRVGLHYLLNFRRGKFTRAVEQGISDAREWCRSRGYPLRPSKLIDKEREIYGDPDEASIPPKIQLPIIVGSRFDPRRTPVAVHNEIEIHASPQRVWETLVKAVEWPRWYANSSNVRIEDGGANLFLGAKFTWTTFWIPLRSRVEQFEPVQSLAWSAEGIGVEAYHAWRIDFANGVCLVKTEETQYGWLARLAHWVAPDLIFRGHRKWLEGLARRAEGSGENEAGDASIWIEKDQRRDLQDLRNLSRSPFLSYARRGAAPTAPRLKAWGKRPAQFPSLVAFSPRRAIAFAASYLRNRIGPRHSFETYRRDDPRAGIFSLDVGEDEVRIALCGDWATGTDEAYHVARQIINYQPHYTIHLGDIYYVGSEEETDQNFLGENNVDNRYLPCSWPCGSVASFALLGNHEMYARGDAYFIKALPALGPTTSGTGQDASYFCLENEHWVIIGLDTGYNSVGFPLVELLFPPDCGLPAPVVEWLKTHVDLGGNKRGIVLLSHHQYYSKYDVCVPRPSVQLAPLIDRPVLWFWGHEHRLVVYGEFGLENGVRAHGRCIGHGGMPVEYPLPRVRMAGCPIEFMDERMYFGNENMRLGFNGFARLTLTGATLAVDYVDLNGDTPFSEQWEVENGTLRRPSASRRAPGRDDHGETVAADRTARAPL
jgi:predicted acylesterase/phospholipase RssA